MKSEGMGFYGCPCSSATTHETTQSGAYQQGQGAVKAKIYTAEIDGKEITLIDTNALPSVEFKRGVRNKFGADRVEVVERS